jgi:transcriptional regulator with AAA-type ATPase domain
MQNRTVDERKDYIMALFSTKQLKEAQEHAERIGAELEQITEILMERFTDWDGNVATLNAVIEAEIESVEKHDVDSLNKIHALEETIQQIIAKQQPQEPTEDEVSIRAAAMLAEMGHPAPVANEVEEAGEHCSSILDELNSIKNPMERAKFRAKNEARIMAELRK